MALVVITSVRVLRCPSDSDRQMWHSFQAQYGCDVGLEGFLATDQERVAQVVQGLPQDKRDALIRLHQNAGMGFRDGFCFEITFECKEPGLGAEELDWKLTYVGSAADEKFDQELDSVLVGPVVIGKNQFVFQCPGPDPDKIPEKDLLGVTVLLLTCSFKGREFIRIGYFLNNEVPGLVQPQPGEAPLPNPRSLLNEMRRVIENATSPRVTKFNIPWPTMDSNGQLVMVTEAPPPQEVVENKSAVAMDTDMMEAEEEDVIGEEEDEEEDEEDEGEEEGDEAEEDLVVPTGNPTALAPHTDSRYALPVFTDSRSHEPVDPNPTFHMPRLPEI